MLIMSTKPLTASASQRERKPAREPEHDHAQRRTARRRRAASCRRSRRSGRRASMSAGEQRARPRARCAAGRARPGPVSRIVCANTGSSAIGAAEEHGEEVERDRAEQDRRAADEADAGEHGVAVRPRSPTLSARAAARASARMQPRPIASSAIGGAVDELGRDGEEQRRRSPGPTIIAAWNAIERSAIAFAISSNGDDRRAGARGPAGTAIAFAQPIATASTRNGHSFVAPFSETTSSSSATTIVDRRVAPAKTRRRGKRSARCPAGSASSGSGANSASPIRPRSNGEWWISKTCQPTATAAICAPSPSTSSATQSNA